MVIVDIKGSQYSVEKNLATRWDGIKDGKIVKYDEDRFYIVDGREGVGKSLFTIQQAAYIDPTILDDVDGVALPRICFSSKEFLAALDTYQSTKEKTMVVVWDEAFRGMSSKAALSKINKEVTEKLMEVRQKNLVVFIVSPSFFMIDFYAAVHRSNVLFHVVKEKGTRKRYVRVFNRQKKDVLYNIGKRKGSSYPIKTYIRARFYNKYPGGDDFEARYRKKKLHSFKSGGDLQIDTHRWKKQRNAAVKMLHNLGKGYQEIVNGMLEHGITISMAQLSHICNDKR